MDLVFAGVEFPGHRAKLRIIEGIDRIRVFG